MISLTKPYKEYQSGQVFTENTGRAIVIHTMESSQEDSQWDDSKLRDLQSGDLQEELQEDVQIEHSQLKACSCNIAVYTSRREYAADSGSGKSLYCSIHDRKSDSTRSFSQICKAS